MKKAIYILFLLIGSINLFGQTLKVNTSKSQVTYVWVKDSVQGKLSGFEAHIEFNPSDLSKSVISGSVDATTLTTGNGMRDKHLQNKDYFETKTFPTFKFKSTSIEKVGSGYQMKGKMTIKEITQDVTIDFRFEDNVFLGKSTIYTNDFEVAKQKDREKSKVVISFLIPMK